MLRAAIKGIGSYVPERVIKNEDLEKLMDTNDEWITKRSGIRERRWVDNEQSTSDLALHASLNALKDSGLTVEDLDAIIFATLSPDHEFPGTGCFLQAKLNAKKIIPAFDIRQQCSGFVYGLGLADSLIASGSYKNILLVGAEIHSRGMDISTAGRDVAVLFGDGAGAVVLSPSEITNSNDAGVRSWKVYSDGNFAKELWVPAPGTGFGGKSRLTKEMVEERLHYPQMNGKTVFINAIARMIEVLNENLQIAKMTSEDIDLYVFHQANLRIIEAIRDKLKIPEHKVFNTIQKYANTTAATIPLTMDEAKKAGVLKPGMNVAMAAFGSGFTWGGAILRY